MHQDYVVRVLLDRAAAFQFGHFRFFAVAGAVNLRQRDDRDIKLKRQFFEHAGDVGDARVLVAVDLFVARPDELEVVDDHHVTPAISGRRANLGAHALNISDVFDVGDGQRRQLVERAGDLRPVSIRQAAGAELGRVEIHAALHLPENQPVGLHLAGDVHHLLPGLRDVHRQPERERRLSDCRSCADDGQFAAVEAAREYAVQLLKPGGIRRFACAGVQQGHSRHGGVNLSNRNGQAVAGFRGIGELIKRGRQISVFVRQIRLTGLEQLGKAAANCRVLDQPDVRTVHGLGRGDLERIHQTGHQLAAIRQSGHLVRDGGEVRDVVAYRDLLHHAVDAAVDRVGKVALGQRRVACHQFRKPRQRADYVLLAHRAGQRVTNHCVSTPHPSSVLSAVCRWG